MRTRLAITLAALLTALAAAAPASAQSSQVVGPWSGQLPFNCKIQDVGTGTNYPRPNADPFCVEFDKRRQNVTGLGLADFLSKEPARVAAAVPKCFYYQRDHWTGSITQGGSPTLWHWDGEYFFDKARGLGGVSVRNFRIGGVPMSPGPYAPAALKPYLRASGGGGAMVLLKTKPDPTCAARIDTPEERRHVYRDWYRRLPG